MKDKSFEMQPGLCNIGEAQDEPYSREPNCTEDSFRVYRASQADVRDFSTLWNEFRDCSLDIVQ